jgi:predicted HicB family RNase H-like nuclease
MAPVTVYLDKETKEKIRAAAKAKNISVSQWVANLIRENLQPRRV